MNLVPYRTQDDKIPPVAVRRAALMHIIKPAVDIPAPKAIVALGKKAATIQDI